MSNQNTPQTSTEIIANIVNDELTAEQNLELAAKEYIDRKNRTSHPDGSFDKKKRFYLSAAEKSDCCSGIRTPSAAYPFSQMLHGRTMEHVANLYNVDVKQLRKAVKVLSK